MSRMERGGAILTLAMMLSACGGDGQARLNDSKAIAPVTPAPTPTPSPSPTPTPTPNPTPTPEPTPSPTPTPTPVQTYAYERAANFTKDQTFVGYDGVKGMAFDDVKWSTAEFISSDTGATTFATSHGRIALPDSSDLLGGGIMSLNQENGASAESIISYKGDFGSVWMGLPAAIAHYEYFAFASFQGMGSARLFLVGHPTNPVELNQASRLTYLAMIAEAHDHPGVKPLPLVVDLSTQQVSGNVPSINEDGTATELQVTGSIDSSNHITGKITSKSGDVTATFRGRLFGRNGKEIALLIISKRGLADQRVSLLTGTLQ